MRVTHFHSSRIGLSLLLIALLLLAPPRPARAAQAGGEVVVYTALDQLYSEPILRRFETQSGLKVRAAYDTEAAKTTGLVSRLIAERARPRCDVFWNNEIANTIRLQRLGALAPYISPAAAGIPARFKDPSGAWTGFAARARVLAYNTNLLQPADLPRSLKDLADPRWRGKVGLAYPLFGTTATHAAFLYQRWGCPAALDFFRAILANGVKVLEGNSASCGAVAGGELPLGLTDSDDASLARAQGKPLDWILIPDAPGGGALLIPNTVALIAGAPHPEAGRKLIDYLLSPQVEAALAASPAAQIPLRPGVPAPEPVQKMARAKFADPQYAKTAEMLAPSAEDLKAVFARP